MRTHWCILRSGIYHILSCVCASTAWSCWSWNCSWCPHGNLHRRGLFVSLPASPLPIKMFLLELVVKLRGGALTSWLRSRLSSWLRLGTAISCPTDLVSSIRLLLLNKHFPWISLNHIWVWTIVDRSRYSGYHMIVGNISTNTSYLLLFAPWIIYSRICDCVMMIFMTNPSRIVHGDSSSILFDSRICSDPLFRRISFIPLIHRFVMWMGGGSLGLSDNRRLFSWRKDFGIAVEIFAVQIFSLPSIAYSFFCRWHISLWFHWTVICCVGACTLLWSWVLNARDWSLGTHWRTSLGDDTFCSRLGNSCEYWLLGYRWLMCGKWSWNLIFFFFESCINLSLLSCPLFFEFLVSFVFILLLLHIRFSLPLLQYPLFGTDLEQDRLDNQMVF